MSFEVKGKLENGESEMLKSIVEKERTGIGSQLEGGGWKKVLFQRRRKVVHRFRS